MLKLSDWAKESGGRDAFLEPCRVSGEIVNHLGRALGVCNIGDLAGARFLPDVLDNASRVGEVELAHLRKAEVKKGLGVPEWAETRV